MSQVSIYCPHCRRFTALSVAENNKFMNHKLEKAPCVWEDKDGYNWWIGICNSCKNPVLVLGEGRIVFPASLPSPTDKTIPNIIRQDLDEAKMCLSVSAFRAAAVLARRCLQNACLNKGASNGNLVDQIDELYEKRIITSEIKSWAHAVRWVGNDAAHPNDDTVEKDEAEDILNLTEQILEILFVAPAIAAKYRKTVKKHKQFK